MSPPGLGDAEALTGVVIAGSADPTWSGLRVSFRVQTGVYTVHEARRSDKAK